MTLDISTPDGLPCSLALTFDFCFAEEANIEACPQV